MFDLSTLSTFVAVVLGLFLIPGPAVLLVLSRTVQAGRKTGVMTGLGIAAGDFVHTIFAAVGLSAVLMTSAIAFNAVKFIGAAYLIYLGIRAIRAKQGNPSLPKVSAVTPARAFLQAVIGKPFAYCARRASEPVRPIERAGARGRYAIHDAFDSLTANSLVLCLLYLLPQYASPGSGPSPLSIDLICGCFVEPGCRRRNSSMRSWGGAG